MLSYRASLPSSRQTLNFAAGITRRHRISIGSPWRKLNPGQQALLVLACLRKGETFASLAAGFGIGTATAWRYVEETVALLAARAARLRKAVRDAARAGHAYVVLDGTLIPIDRVATDRPFYSMMMIVVRRHRGRPGSLMMTSMSRRTRPEDSAHMRFSTTLAGAATLGSHRPARMEKRACSRSPSQPHNGTIGAPPATCSARTSRAPSRQGDCG